MHSFRLPHPEYDLLAIRDEASDRIEAADPAETGVVGGAYDLHTDLEPGKVTFSDPFHSDLTRAVSVEAAYSNGRRTVLALIDLGEISAKLVLVAQSPSDWLGIVDGSCLVSGLARVRSEGHEYYASSMALPGTTWPVLYLRSAADADAPMTAFIAFFAWRNISTPLSSFVSRIDRIAEGHCAERIVGESSLEFREIGRAFNEMADSIGKRDRELQRSEERYRLLFHRDRVPALIVEPAAGAIRDVNDAALSYYGYSMEELQALSLGSRGERLRHKAYPG